MGLKIRPMSLLDVDVVYNIELVGHKAPWKKEIFRDCVIIGYDCRVIETDAKEIVGYLIARQASSLCHLLNLCIAPKFQRHGMGRRLLSDLIANPPSSVINAIVLEVRPSNKGAIKLYENLGFNQYDIKKEYYRDENGVEDALVFIKELSLYSFRKDKI